MTLRDIKVLLNLIENKESLGLPIDYSIYWEFENKTQTPKFFICLWKMILFMNFLIVIIII